MRLHLQPFLSLPTFSLDWIQCALPEKNEGGVQEEGCHKKRVDSRSYFRVRS